MLGVVASSDKALKTARRVAGFYGAFCLPRLARWTVVELPLTGCSRASLQRALSELTLDVDRIYIVDARSGHRQCVTASIDLT